MSIATASTYGSITDEAVAEVRRRLNKVYPIDEPFVCYVNSDSIGHAARAIGDMNPLWIDAAHGKSSRFARCVAPPALLYAVDTRRFHRNDINTTGHQPVGGPDQIFGETLEFPYWPVIPVRWYRDKVTRRANIDTRCIRVRQFQYRSLASRL